jgi:hypothetical protein
LNAVLAAEITRTNRDVSRILAQSTLASEVPIRIHSRDTDSGGAPEFHQTFVRWVGSICTCGKPAQCAPGCRADRPDEHTADCEPACPTENARFHASDHKSRPNRLKRALRQLRRIDPKAHDAIYMLLVLGYSWHETLARLNSDNVSRGKDAMSQADFLVLTIAGGSLLTAAY